MESIEPQAGYFFSAARQQNLEKKKKSKKSEKATFSKILRNNAGNNINAEPELVGKHDELSLEEMLDDIHSLGDRLRNSHSFDDIKAYRDAVKKFLAYVVDNMLCFEQHVSGSGIDKRKKYSLIRIIDRKMESLVAGIILNQIKQLDILEKLEEIQGMLVDLLS
ncbi:DUF327 family protein [Spirochaetia bacterium 38H-sp]|uniref:DUF327 family protein n=1 Tax=Rarispira pelagica TaxID=3141764 RepID=A0ABU9UF68_9SPIR